MVKLIYSSFINNNLIKQEYILDIKNGKNDIIKRVYKNADKEQKYEDYGKCIHIIISLL